MAAKFEVMLLPSANRRSRRAMFAFCNSFSGSRCVRTESYTGQSDWLVVFGWGSGQNQQAMKKHMESGRNVLVMDMGYLKRGRQTVRFSVNALHPTDQLQFAPDGSRFERTGVELSNVHNQDGHSLVLQLTRKSRNAFGYSGNAWERNTVSRFLADRPYGRIVLRPKRGKAENVDGTFPSVLEFIADDLYGCSRVAVHHSNVAIDAAILGVPCYAEHGVGAGVYTDPLGTALSEAQRRKFLEQVAWFNWELDELKQMVQFAEHVAGQL